MSDDFVRDLEEELVAAARYRAGRRRHRVRLPRPARRSVGGALLGAATVAAIVALAAFALSRGDDDRAAVERRATPPPAGLVVPLVPMIESASCRGLEVRDEPAFAYAGGIGLFERAQRKADSIPPPRGNVVTWVPVRTFDPSESRLAGYKRLPTIVHAFPSLGVSTDGDCTSDDGPGICLVEVERDFRCFTSAQVLGGGAIALSPDGWAIGIVPDGIDKVDLTARGKTTTAEVVENVYAARLGVPAGSDVRVAPAALPAGCTSTLAVAPELLERVAVLGRPAEAGHPLPRPALASVREWQWQLDAIFADGARFWGGGEEVEFWAVPVVPRAAKACGSATGVCIVAVTSEGRANSHCIWDKADLRAGTWRIGPLFSDRAVDFRHRARRRDRRAGDDRIPARGVDARDNVIGGVVPFPYSNGADTRVDLIRRPASPKPRSGSWRPAGMPSVVKSVARRGRLRDAAEDHAGREAAGDRAGVLAAGADAEDARRSTSPNWSPPTGWSGSATPERVPRPVLETDAPVVVVVGSG